MQRFLLMLFFYSCLGFAQDTLLKLYRPFAEILNQATHPINKINRGDCLKQSMLITREDAWQCESEGVIYDPCFVKAGANRTDALCPQSPWVGDSIQIKVNHVLDNQRNQALDMSSAYPWAVELENGIRCMAINTTEQYDQMPIRYRCYDQSQLIGHLQRCDPVWTMIQRTPKELIMVRLSKVWF